MGGEKAAGVLSTVKRAAVEKSGGTFSDEDEAAIKTPVMEQFETHQTSFGMFAQI